MSFVKLDAKGQPIPKKGRSSRKPAERGEGADKQYHYDIYVSILQADGRYKQKRRREWLRSDKEAEAIEDELKHGVLARNLTWLSAHRQWLSANAGGISEGHAKTSIAAVEQWAGDFGAQATIEGTTLAQFSAWIAAKAADGTGRAAQIKYEHMLAIARWCRARGLIASIPFEHCPKPAARTKKRKPAPVNLYFAYLDRMHDGMHCLWRMLALTGMRISAACELKEADIGEHEFTVLTKFRKYVPYPRTPETDKVIEDARRFKAERGIDSPYLFTKANGNPWKKDYYNSCLRRIAEQENKVLRRAEEEERGKGTKYEEFPVITSHQIRHMAGTLLAEKNMSADIIQAGLAHDSRASAENYIDQTMGMRRTAMATLASALTLAEKLQKSDMKSARTAPNPSKPSSPKPTAAHCPLCPFISLYLKQHQ